MQLSLLKARMSWRYLLLVLLFVACKEEIEVAVESTLEPALMEIPNGFPQIEEPEGNAFTEARWELGKKLFFDPIMSVDSTLSCASCHKPELAFSDDVALTDGVGGVPGTRNAPTLANVAYHPYLTREGGVPTLEMQVLVPIQEHNEFNFNIVLIAERLAKDSIYIKMSRDAYNRPPDHFVITRSIACFERSLISGNSSYDLYEYGDDPLALTDEALEGKALFFSSRTNCSTCHGGFNFTNYTLENNGLYEVYEDPGLFRLTDEESDRARFKVPSLRNVELTAPYMHDGSIATLEEVVEHYNSGGSNHANKSQHIRPLLLTTDEKKAIVAFLKTLTDQTFINNPFFKP